MDRMILNRRFLFLSLGLCFVMVFMVGGSFFRTTEADNAISLDSFSRPKSVSVKPMLRWNKVAEVVAYEIELYSEPLENEQARQSHPMPFFSTNKISVNGFNADLSAHLGLEYFYWRVRGLDVDDNPISDFSEIKKVYVDWQRVPQQKPIPTSIFNQSAGSTLLYPVYAWIPIAGAEKYEVEILDEIPENPNEVAPSIHRIDSAIAVGFDYYDETPRLSSRPFWWRVRGLDANGNPVGVYSDAGEFSVNPDFKIAVATFGDSITHGGGGVSHSPADWEYSYLNYLDFPTLNLGRSSDTSRDDGREI